MAKKVVVGMSGGVDSSVAALLLKSQGYEVIGVTMQIYEEEDRTCRREERGCCGLSAVEDARRVAGVLKIPYYVMDFTGDFRRQVMDYFTEEYLHGRTPNPCIACNRFVKWEGLLERSLSIGADFIATGHYARIEALPNGRLAVKNSVTAEKDQTYVLYSLSQEQLAHTLMPVGDYDKPTIRKMAEEAGLPVAHKRDSEDICFIPDGDTGAFLDRELGDRSPGQGNYLDMEGNVLGSHRGITHVTIGQRKGLGIALGKRAFVQRIDAEKNEVVLGEDSDLYSDTLRASSISYMGEERFDEKKRYLGKIRYSDPGTFCRVRYEGEELVVTFEEKVRAATPGQALVLYDGDYVAGGGVIC